MIERNKPWSFLIGCIFLMQPLWLLAQPFQFKVYREADGLPSGYVQKIMEDRKGYLWICTYGGLSRFDGRNFKNFDIKSGLSGNFCDELYEDSSGTLWIGTRGGLSSFDGKQFRRYPHPDSSRTPYFSLMRTGEKGLQFILNRKNACLENGQVIYTPTTTKIPGLYEGGESCTVGILNDGSSVLNTSIGIYILTTNNQLQYVASSDNLSTSFFFQPQEKNTFYFFNRTGVYRWWNGQLKKLTEMSFSDHITTALYVDKQKRVWISSEGKGIWMIDGSKTFFIEPQQLPGALVTAFYQDRRGTMWISTFRGLVKLTDQFVTQYTLSTGLDIEDIRFSTKLADGRIVMQTNIIDHGEPRLLPGDLNKKISYAAVNSYFSSLQYDHVNKKWWIMLMNRETYTSQKGMLRNVSRSYPMITSANSIYNAVDSTLWLGCNNTVTVIKNDSVVKRFTALSDGGSLNYVSSLHKDHFGHIWVAETNRILLLTEKGLIDFTPKLGLAHRVHTVYACSDRKGVWFAAKGLGAYHFSFNNGQWTKDGMINSDNGLQGNYIHDIEIDERNNIWIATLNGLYRFTANKTVPGGYLVRSFSSSDGIDVPNWNLAYLEKDSLQNIWLGTGNGIFRIHTPRIAESGGRPSISIEKVAIVNSAKPGLEQGVRLPAVENDISFNFNGINLDNEYIRYSYMLRGRDQDWITAQNDEAIYYNLSAGKYTFKVKAVNDAGVESDVAEFNFTIIPPFWQTWWFRTAMSLLAVGVIYWFIRRRDKIREKENNAALQVSELKLRALQSQMNPHFIFNSMNSIQNYIMQQKPVDAARYLSKFSKLMRRILDHSFNTLTPLSEIVETLRMYMELEAFRFSNEFSWELKVDNADSISGVKLPPLLLQPYVENAIIHGLMPKEGEKKLLIHLFKKNNVLHCVIDDNGVGRGNKLTATEGHISRGQKLTTDMLATLQQLLHSEARIDITDKKDVLGEPLGTTVDLVIPLND